METYKSEFDKPIALYDLIGYVMPDNGVPVLFNNLRLFVVYGELPLKQYLKLLQAWGWIAIDKQYNVLRLTRPTENIILRPRPVQEDFS